MGVKNRGAYSAASSALGYLYQVRYALLEALRRLRKGQEFLVSIETLDDVVFEKAGEAPQLLQAKHHLNQAADLTDGSPDIWKTLRVWCEAMATGNTLEGTLFFLTISQISNTRGINDINVSSMASPVLSTGAGR